MIKITSPQKPQIILLMLSLCVTAYSQSSTPEFTLSDQNGVTISQKGDANGRQLTSVTVSAGKEYTVKSIIAVLARGDVRVATLSSTSEVIDINNFRIESRPGDRVIFTIKKVAKIANDKEVEIIDTNKSITIPIK